MVIVHITSTTLVLRKKMQQEDGHEADLAEAGKLPSKSKTGWRTHTSLAQFLFKSAKKKKKKEKMTPFLRNR